MVWCRKNKGHSCSYKITTHLTKLSVRNSTQKIRGVRYERRVDLVCSGDGGWERDGCAKNGPAGQHSGLRNYGRSFQRASNKSQVQTAPSASGLGGKKLTIAEKQKFNFFEDYDRRRGAANSSVGVSNYFFIVTGENNCGMV